MAENFEKIEKNLETISDKFQNISQNLTVLEKNNVQDVQGLILDSLYQIRKDLLEEIKTHSQSKQQPKENQLVNNEGDSNKKIEELTEENRRLNYRISHLVKGIKELVENKEAEDLKKENEKLKYRIKILLRNFE